VQVLKAISNIKATLSFFIISNSLNLVNSISGIKHAYLRFPPEDDLLLPDDELPEDELPLDEEREGAE
jgi:hypothetical protein